MRWRLTSRRAAVMTGGAHSSRRVQTVIGLGPYPRRGGLVTIFTGGLSVVNGRCWLCRCAVHAAVVACGALG